MKQARMIATVAVLILGTAGVANATGWGVGGFGGVTIPLVQDDATRGTLYGAHLRLSIGGMLGIEPNFIYFKNGDWEIDDAPGETFDGSKFTSVGVNLILGAAGPVTGFRFFPFAGAKYYNEKNDFRDFSDSHIGWCAGMGLEIGAGSLGIDIRASGEVLPLDGGGSRKWAHIRGGLNYYFGIR
ncbi:MAG: hypothetical protein AB1792_09255 [Candidatus Zixiibacteriota bacterium]